MSIDAGQNQGISVFPEKGLDEYLVEAWRRKWWIAAGTLLAAVIGVIYALLCKPVYETKAVIAAKQSQQQGGAASMFSSLGGLGGLAAAQFGIGVGEHDHMAIILKSREFLERVIEENRLTPKLFPAHWDAAGNRWKNPDSTTWPRTSWSVVKLEKNVDVKSNKKQNVIEIEVEAGDPRLAREIADDFLATFNAYLRETAEAKAKSNIAFLEERGRQSVDPLLIERIQGLIAGEIEKAMLMHGSGFEVLQQPFLPLQRSRPNRSMIVASCIVAGFVLSLFAVFLVDYLLALRRHS